MTGNLQLAAKVEAAALNLCRHFPWGVYGDRTLDRAEVARANGAFSIAVATGRHDAETLARVCADRVFADLSDTESDTPS